MINNFNTCVESIDEKLFFIQDGDNQKSAFIVEKNGEFEVANNTSDPIKFLKIDSCVSNSSDNTRCDCAIYNSDTFCFIELKCIKPTSFSKNRKKAEKQLEATIEEFDNEDIIKNKNLEAYVCSNCKTEKDTSYEPITQQPKNTNQTTYFEFELNTKLYYSTKKEFN